LQQGLSGGIHMVFGQVGKDMRGVLAQALSPIGVLCEGCSQIETGKALRMVLQIFPGRGQVTTHVDLSMDGLHQQGLLV
jgi:hypothetical protein